MPPQLTPLVWNDFHAGWCPSDDAKNGRKNCLLQMDNLELDKNGALTLIGGTQVVRSLGSHAHTLYSRVISGVRNDYVSLENGDTYRNDQKLFANGDLKNSAFATAFDFVLATSGVNRLKDTGSGIDVKQLGIEIPSTAPTLEEQVQLFTNPFAIGLFYIAVSGTVRGEAGGVNGIIRLRANQDTGVGIIQTTEDNGSNFIGLPYDWSRFPDGSTQTDNDVLTIAIGSFLKGIDSFTIEIMLDPGNAAGDPVENAYSFTPTLDDFIPFDAEADIYGGYFLRIKRSQFVKRGTGSQGWSTVYGFRITYTTPFFGVNDKTLELGLGYLDEINFVGGSSAQDGIYEYALMYVNNTGAYLGKSELGPASAPVTSELFQSKLNFVKPLDPQVNEIWLFRRSVEGGGLLDQWYRVQRILPGSWNVPILDNLGDQDALTLDITVNLNLRSIASSRTPERIVDIIGPIEGRWLYFTDTFMYPSDINDPDLIDVSKGIRTVAGASEKFLWARNISDSLVLVGTSNDMYLLSGTFQTLPDEEVDIYYKPLTCKYPPITYDAVVYNGAIYYLASDGWRSFSIGGGNPLLVSPNLDRLYRGISCYGYTAPNIKILPGTVRFPVTINDNKLYCFITGAGRYEVYDFVRNYWRPVTYGLGDVTAVTWTQDGRVLAFFADGVLRIIEIHVSDGSKKIDGGSEQSFTLLTPILDGGYPHQRKDPYTLTIRCYTPDHTHNDGIVAKIYVDGGEVDTVAPSDTSVEPFYINNVPEFALAKDGFIDLIQRVPIAKNYQIKFNGMVPDLNLTDITIDCGLRPPQITSYRFHNTNFGNASKKRVRVWPIIIDTGGARVQFTPYVDGQTVSAEETIISTPILDSSGRSPGGVTHRIYFTTDIFGVDYGYTLRSIDVDSHGNEFPFELWDTMSPAIVQVLPIAKRFDQVGPDELFRYGKIKQFEIRILPDNGNAGGVSALPVRVFMNDNTEYEVIMQVWNRIEASYFIGVPKGIAGEIVRIEIGPTCYDFHRWYVRLQVAKSGMDTDLLWVTLPSPESTNGLQ